jgi:hypothetical protein
MKAELLACAFEIILVSHISPRAAGEVQLPLSVSQRGKVTTTRDILDIQEIHKHTAIIAVV